MQTQAIVDHLESTRMPHIFVVNKMDRPGADFAATLAALQNAYGRHVVAEQCRSEAPSNSSGYVDLAAHEGCPAPSMGSGSRKSSRAGRTPRAHRSTR